MSRNPTSTLLIVALAAAGLMGGLYLYLSLPGGGPAREPEPLELDYIQTPAESARPEPTVELVPAARVAVEAGEWTQPSSVLWPCRVELELIQADYLPTESDVPPVRSGQKARLSGLLVGDDDLPVPGEIEFVAGPNEGRILYCDENGAFGATDLYPGLAIVDVRGPGIVGARREVRLRQNAETLLNLGFGLLGSVHGNVVDRKGEPVRGAKVLFDGQSAYTGTEGGFYFGGVASGFCVVEVEHDDFASLLRIVPVTVGREIPPGKLTLTLDESTSLSISTPNPVGGPGPTYVYVLPASTARARFGTGPGVQTRRYPWYRLNPIEVPSSSPVVLDDLPVEVVKVIAFRPGAVAREQVANLRQGRVTPVQVRLRQAPLLTGVVRLGDKPLPGVEVTLEAPDQVRANLGYLRQPSTYLESEVMPYLPPAKQVTRTNHEGRYIFTAWADVAEVRYLEARGPNSTWAGQLVHEGEERVDLDLRSVELGDSALLLELPGRHQGLPMEVIVNGTPRATYMLAPRADFRVEPLVAGRWSLKVSWDSEPVLLEPDFLLDGARAFRAALPRGAVDGQDEEAWRRAGRVWPF
ncbi:MAG: carboxypeptidase-like regulatory domain-containing protein [Planctomycetota bacterium]